MINIYNIFVRMKIYSILPLFFLLLSNVLAAQAPPSHSSSDILQDIRKLRVLGSVLYIAAHPDDENTRLLAWLSKDRMVRTGYLSITRGDGGQNLIGDEQGIELGLIRTQELLAARRVDGAEQFFTRGFDFGFSKRTEEALEFWNEKKVLGDVVWVIRKFRPDVIITRFPPDSRAGHGHHSASSVLAREAFKVAADSNAYPGQFKYGVHPWQAKRILWNSYRFGGINTTSRSDLNMDVGGYSTLLGRSYGEIAAESRSQHKSQGFGMPALRGEQLEYFAYTNGSKPTKDILEGVDMGWSRIGASGITKAIDNIINKYSIINPASSIPALLALYKEIDRLPSSYWTERKKEEVKQIVAEAAGLWMEAYVTEPFAVQGDSIRVNMTLNNRDGATVKLRSLKLNDFDTTINRPAPTNKNLEFVKVLAVPANMHISQPYYLREKMEKGSYNVSDQELIGLPQLPPPFTVTFDVNIGGQHFSYMRPVQYRYTHPVKGELYEPLVVIPSADKRAAYGQFRHISYDHIPDIYYFNKDTAKVAIHDVKIDGKNIGYIEGAGDKVAEGLTLMGYNVTLLQPKDLTLSTLSRFDAVVTGVRAYNVHQFLSDKNDVLNEYVKNGGNLVVQYNTNSNLGPNTATIGPLPFHISRNRVTDENSPVKFLLPDHPVLNYPNRITKSDFDGWVQERGIYFAEQLDPAFVTPLAMSDPGEEEHKGSLIIADYGKGKFVYTGLVFFRELPAGVSGAYRLLANIIALNKNSK